MDTLPRNDHAELQTYEADLSAEVLQVIDQLRHMDHDELARLVAESIRDERVQGMSPPSEGSYRRNIGFWAGFMDGLSALPLFWAGALAMPRRFSRPLPANDWLAVGQDLRVALGRHRPDENT